MLSSGSFISLHFKYWSVINFELILVKGIRYMFDLAGEARGCPVIPTPFVEKLYLFHCIEQTLVKEQLTVFM